MDKKIKNKIVDFSKKKYLKNKKLDNVIFCIDSEDNIHILKIQEDKLISDERLNVLLSKILKSRIKKLEKKIKLNISNIVYLKEINTELLSKNNFNIEDDTKNINDKKLMLYTESKFVIDLDFFDVIQGIDNGEKYLVMSNTPINNFRFSKLDIEDDLKGNLTNFLK